MIFNTGKGKDGKSAYQIYVEQGGTLTEAQWLASLKATPPEYAASVDDMTDTSKVYLGANGHLWAYTSKEREKIHWNAGKCPYRIGEADTITPDVNNSTTDEIYFQNGSDIYLYFTQDVIFTSTGYPSFRYVYFDSDNKVLSAYGRDFSSTYTFVSGMQYRIPYIQGAKYVRVRISIAYPSDAENDADYILNTSMSEELVKDCLIGYTTGYATGSSYSPSETPNYSITPLISVIPGETYKLSAIVAGEDSKFRIVYYSGNTPGTAVVKNATSALTGIYNETIVIPSDVNYIVLRKFYDIENVYQMSLCKDAAVTPAETGWQDTGIAYANYALTQNDKETIAQKVLDYLDVTSIDLQNVLTIGSYELDYGDSGTSSLGEVDNQ